MAQRCWLLLALVLAGCTAPERYPIIPNPEYLERRSGELVLNQATRITLSNPTNPELRELAELWVSPLRAASGLPLPVSLETHKEDPPGSIMIG
jgi:hypothetical protein